MKSNLRVGDRAKVRFLSGKLRVCNVHSILSGGLVALLPEHSNKIHFLRAEDTLLEVWNNLGELYELGRLPIRDDDPYLS